MNINIKSPVSTLTAIITGGIILLGYFIPLDSIPLFKGIHTSLLSAAILLTAFALLLGIFNLFAVHLEKIRQGSKNSIYSIFLIGALVITFLLTVFLKPSGQIPRWIFTYIQIPVETSLMAILSVSMTFAIIRLLNQRRTALSIIFLLSTLIVLIGSGPIFGIRVPLINSTIQPYVTQVLSGAGARGILIGVGLGSVATGFRILLGADRPYSN